MDIKDLPSNRKDLGFADEVSEAIFRLSGATLFEERTPFRFFDIVQGAESSGRIFFQNRPDSSIPVVDLGERSFLALAHELFNFNSQARFSPAEAPEPDAAKGWRFQEAIIGGQPTLIAWATWIITRKL